MANDIPEADMSAGYKIRIDRAIDELMAAIVASKPELTAEQGARIRSIVETMG